MELLPATQDSKKGVTLAWKNLCVETPTVIPSLFGRRNKTNVSYKRILDNVSGIAYPGSLIAIMGASGAGKTTLLETLAQRASADLRISGSMLVNGQNSGKYVRSISSFVYQKDLFYANLTVKEHLHFMARMKMDRRLRSSDVRRRVEELLVQLSLKKCQNTRIGRGVSGGEKKRLALASELLTDKPICFTDEPTTGVDAYSAKSIVGIMQEMADRGITVFCTIHQPSSQLFSMFDQVCVLAEGRTAFMGRTTEMLAFLKNLNYICPDHFNPAEFCIRTLAIVPGKEAESFKTINEICDRFAQSEAQNIGSKVDSELQNSKELNLNSSIGDQNAFPNIHEARPNWFTITFWLTYRGLLESFRHPRLHISRSIQRVVIGILFGLCYLGLLTPSQKGIQAVQGVTYLLINENSFRNVFAVMAVFPFEFPILMREIKGKVYGVNSYYIAKIISLFPGFVIESLIITSLTYWIGGLRATFSAFIFTFLFITLVANAAAAFGCWFSASFTNINLAFSVANPFIEIMIMVGGLYTAASLPVYMSWLRYISWYHYSYEGISIAQWQDVSNITCELPTTTNIPCILRSGNDVLASLGFDAANTNLDIISLLGFYVLYHFLAYLSILIRTHRN